MELGPGGSTEYWFDLVQASGLALLACYWPVVVGMVDAAAGHEHSPTMALLGIAVWFCYWS